MLRFPGLFLLLAVIAGAIGYGGFAPGIAEFCKTLFFALFALAAVGCVINRLQDPAELPEPDDEPDGHRAPGE